MIETSAPGGFRLRRYDNVGSTSDICIRLAAEGDAADIAVLSAEQSAGRGSNGRRWESAAGNLFLSVLLRPRAKITAAGGYSLLAGLVLVEALEEFVRAPGAFSLKWPNDVLLMGAKVAGVLVETAASAAGELAWLVIGFGANLAVAPVIAGRAAACLADTGMAAPEPLSAANALLARLAYWRRIEAARGFAPVRAAWLARAHPSGTPLTVVAADGEHHGRFAGLDADGALLLATQSGIARWIAGEVRFTAGAAPCCS
ncbi:MAG: biotin--[acetyl-CoA-carboxylase] ligase [Acetobacteraceae bacterium]